MLRDAKAIIIDEATVLYRTVLEELDRTLPYIWQSDLLMGGIPPSASISSTPPKNHHPSGPIFNCENFKPKIEPNLPKLKRETNLPTYYFVSETVK